MLSRTLPAQSTTLTRQRCRRHRRAPTVVEVQSRGRGRRPRTSALIDMSTVGGAGVRSRQSSPPAKLPVTDRRCRAAPSAERRPEPVSVASDVDRLASPATGLRDAAHGHAGWRSSATFMATAESVRARRACGRLAGTRPRTSGRRDRVAEVGGRRGRREARRPVERRLSGGAALEHDAVDVAELVALAGAELGASAGRRGTPGGTGSAARRSATRTTAGRPPGSDVRRPSANSVNAGSSAAALP